MQTALATRTVQLPPPEFEACRSPNPIRTPIRSGNQIGQTMGDQQTSLVQKWHVILLHDTPDNPMQGVECLLIAASTLTAIAGADPNLMPGAAELAWTEGVVQGRTRVHDVPGNSELITITLWPDETKYKIAESILAFAHESGVPYITCAALCLQLAAGWASSSCAINKQRFVQAAQRAVERGGNWFEFEEANAG